MKKRATSQEKQKRIAEVQKRIIRGDSDNDIISWITKRHGFTRRNGVNYLKWAYDGLKPLDTTKIEDRRARAVARLMQMAKDLPPKERKTSKGVNALLRVERQLARLEGTEMPRRHFIEGDLKTEIKPTKYIDATLKDGDD